MNLYLHQIFSFLNLTFFILFLFLKMSRWGKLKRESLDTSILSKVGGLEFNLTKLMWYDCWFVSPFRLWHACTQYTSQIKIKKFAHCVIVVNWDFSVIFFYLTLSYTPSIPLILSHFSNWTVLIMVHHTNQLPH